LVLALTLAVALAVAPALTLVVAPALMHMLVKKNQSNGMIGLNLAFRKI
jgi:Na+(H+)/acetate symporter ActP